MKMKDKICLRPYYLHCIPVDLGCIVLGYVQVIAAAVVFTAFLVYYMTCVDKLNETKDHLDGETEPEAKREALLHFFSISYRVMMCIGAYIVCGVEMALGVYLVYGMRKRKSGFVLAYFVCGMILDTILLISALYIFYAFDDLFIPIFTFTVGVLYLLCLHMVFMGYSNIRVEKHPDPVNELIIYK